MASDLLVAPMDKIIEPTVHCILVGTTIEKDVFTDLDYAGGV